MVVKEDSKSTARKATSISVQPLHSPLAFPEAIRTNVNRASSFAALASPRRAGVKKTQVNTQSETRTNYYTARAEK